MAMASRLYYCALLFIALIYTFRQAIFFCQAKQYVYSPLKQQLDNKDAVCNQEVLDSSFVTACSDTLCESMFDDLKEGQAPRDKPQSGNKVVHVVSSRDGLRFKVYTYDALDTDEHFYAESRVNASLFADTKVQYQRILGFGTTLTDSSCLNLNSLSEDTKTKVINEYFGHEHGLRMNLIQIPIGSTKFSTSNYALEFNNGSELAAELSIYDSDYRFPIIKEAFKVAGSLKNRIKLIASSASAPSSLKENNQLINGGRLLDDKYIDYANYLLSFVRQYKDEGINIWGLVLSKEPASVAKLVEEKKGNQLNYMSMEMKPSDAIKLIKAIEKIKPDHSLGNNLKLFLFGDTKEYMPLWADTVLKDRVGQKYIGIAYQSNYQEYTPYDNLVYVTLRHPRKYFLVFEAGRNKNVKIGNWQHGENYATDIVKNFEYGAVGWMEPNMVSDLYGSPTINSTFNAASSIIVDTKRGAFYRNPMLYAIGHFSRYVTPGSMRVKLLTFSHPQSYATQQIAFVTPDNYLVVFISNNNIEPMAIELGYDTRTKAQVVLETKSFNTFILKL